MAGGREVKHILNLNLRWRWVKKLYVPATKFTVERSPDSQ